MGIWGHSGGGYAAADAMFDYPDFFKVGISESGNHDNRNYEDDSVPPYNMRRRWDYFVRNLMHSTPPEGYVIKIDPDPRDAPAKER